MVFLIDQELVGHNKSLSMMDEDSYWQKNLALVRMTKKINQKLLKSIIETLYKSLGTGRNFLHKIETLDLQT